MQRVSLKVWTLHNVRGTLLISVSYVQCAYGQWNYAKSTNLHTKVNNNEVFGYVKESMFQSGNLFIVPLCSPSLI